MAVRYKREYDLIIGEMVDALKHLEGYFEFLGLGARNGTLLVSKFRTNALRPCPMTLSTD